MLLGESRVSMGGDGLVEAENQPAIEADAAQFLASEIGPRYRQRVQPFQAPTLPGCSLSAQILASHDGFSRIVRHSVGRRSPNRAE